MQLFPANLVNFSNSCSKKSFDSLLLDRRTVTRDPLKEETFYYVDLSW